MRLKTIKVDAEKSAAGLLGPGDRVDVQLFVRKDQRTGVDTAKSKIILQNVRVFAVDQTIQRSADGGEERSVAKTVSLMLTPEQASKLSLAEQIGEISLIPRNPDDEESAVASEYTVDDLLADGEANSRAKEQGATEHTAGDHSSNGLLNAVQTVASQKAPFRMEVVEAQAVREVLFDSDTGQPIRSSAQSTTPAGPTLHPMSEFPASGGPAPAPAAPDKLLEEFPVDFNQPK